MGLTGVIKEALMLSFLLIPGKTPALICFFCRHLCTTSLRLFDAWNASYASGSRASKLKQQQQVIKDNGDDKNVVMMNNDDDDEEEEDKNDDEKQSDNNVGNGNWQWRWRKWCK